MKSNSELFSFRPSDDHLKVLNKKSYMIINVTNYMTSYKNYIIITLVLNFGSCLRKLRKRIRKIQHMYANVNVEKML